MARIYVNMYHRLVSNCAKPEDQNENGCWFYTGKLDRYGYGQINKRVDGKHVSVKAHREMEQQFRDAPLDPELETLDHLCGNENCINVDHWVPRTRSDHAKVEHERRKTCRATT